MQSKKILVVIPTFNCEAQITRVLEGFDQALLRRVMKVIVIDNGSSDNTVVNAKKAAKRISSKVEVWQNSNNYNLGGTHKVAFLEGEKMNLDYVAILHGDNQAKTEELHNLFDSAEQNPELGAILGCRFMRGSVVSGYRWQRRLGNRAINVIYSLVTLRLSKDLGSGLNLFKLSSLSDHRYLGFDDTITFNIDLLLDFYKKKTPITFIPITWTEEDQVSNARNFSVGLIALKKLFLWRIGKSSHTFRSPKYYKSSEVV